MNTLAHTDRRTHPMFAAVVAHVAACAHTKMGESQAGKIDQAAAIVLAGGVDGGAVQSQHRPETWYDVVGNVCTCEDYARHATHESGYVCKHVVATWLDRYVTQRMAHEAPVPVYDRPPVPPCDVPTDSDGVPCYAVASVCPGHSVPAPVVALPLPEAPASANCFITLAGRQVQVTLRDTCETRLFERLDALLQRFAVDAPAPALHTAAPVVAEVSTPTCPEHGDVMKPSVHQPNGLYCPKKMPDGTYCKSYASQGPSSRPRR